MGDGPSASDTPSGDAGLPTLAAEEICAGCGLPLTRRGAHGECLRCALQVAWEEDQEPDGDPPPPVGTPAAPRLRYGHFEVARGFDGQPVELGSGAMATTYRAHDTVLQVPVALKVISQSVAGHPAARARFLREARATARLHHPNVASVTFYGEQAGECFYAMELVEGETLAERVRRAGVLSAEQALEVGVQVARALAAAESHGVVHRDLKPSNLMLVGAPPAAPPTPPGAPAAATKPPAPPLHVKVIDWGLAKAVNAAHEALGAEHTHGAFVGTPAYASPEQFARAWAGAGGEQRLDTRSDIYSLGVTLWYLLCGRVPFVGNTLESIHARQRALPLEQLRAARVPACLAAALRSMVAFDPAARPQNARELLDALLRCRGRHPERAPLLSRRRRPLQAAGVLLLLLLALGLAAGAKLWPPRRPPALATAAPEPVLAVLPFKSLDPDASHKFFTLGMQDEIVGVLARAARMRVLSVESTQAYQPDRARDYKVIAAALGVSHLLEGSVRRTKEGVRMTVRLVDPKQPERTWENGYEGRLGDVFGLQGQIADAVATRLQVPLDARERSGLNRPLTTDPAAHDLYLRSRALEQEDVTASDDVQMHRDQIPLLEAAVARDPHFTRAYCDLSAVYLWLYNVRTLTPAGKETVDYRSLADVALAKARRLEPGGGEVHLATANVLYTTSHDNEQARIEADLARATLPNNRDVEFLTGEIAFGQGRWGEATRLLEHAEALDPQNWRQRFDVAQYYRHLRQSKPFEEDMARVLAGMTVAEKGYYWSVAALGAFELEGNLARLEDAVAALSPADDPDGRTSSIYHFLLGLYSRDPNAVARALTDYHVDPVRQGTHLYPRAWYEALLARLRGDDTAAAASFAAARQWLAKQVAANPDDGWMLSTLAVVDAGLGHKEEALREALRAVELTPYGRDLDYASCVRGNLALTCAWTGRPDQALDTLCALTNKPGSFDVPAQPSYGDLRWNPCWDPLRGDPIFEMVTQRFGQPLLDP